MAQFRQVFTIMSESKGLPWEIKTFLWYTSQLLQLNLSKFFFFVCLKSTHFQHRYIILDDIKFFKKLLRCWKTESLYMRGGAWQYMRWFCYLVNCWQRKKWWTHIAIRENVRTGHDSCSSEWKLKQSDGASRTDTKLRSKWTEMKIKLCAFKRSRSADVTRTCRPSVVDR